MDFNYIPVYFETVPADSFSDVLKFSEGNEKLL